MVAMEDLGNGIEVAGEVALRSLGDAVTTPGDEDMLWQGRIWVLNLDEAELDSALIEVLEKLAEFALCRNGVSLWLECVRVPRDSRGRPYHRLSLP